MSIFWRFLQAGAFIMLLLPAAFLTTGFLATNTIVSEVHRTIPALPGRVWSAATDWRAISSHADVTSGISPIKSRIIVGGGPLGVGKVVKYPLGHGKSWNQLLTAWQPGKRYAFRNQSSGSGVPTRGKVMMAFALTPAKGGATDVDFKLSVTSRGVFDKALALVFGRVLGTMKGYQGIILGAIASASQSPVAVHS